MAFTGPSNRCTVCSSPFKAQIHALYVSKMTLEDISTETRKLGAGRQGGAIKRSTLGRHFRFCLHGETPLLDEGTAQAIVDGSKGAKGQAEIDFATLVQRRATALLANGDLRVTASHGLAAQALIDHRAEKQADRNLALNMARLLSGAIQMTPITVIESRAVPLLDDGLAPEGVFEPADA